MSTSTIIIGREALLPALALAVRVVERRNTIPVLANLMLRAEDDQLTLTATDLDIEVTTSRSCKITGPAAATTLPAFNLHDIVRKLPEGCEVKLTSDKHEWMIAGGRSRFRLQCLPVDDFPTMSAVDMSVSFSLATELVKSMIETVRFAISTEETRYYLNGIHWHPTETSAMIAVATDGHRLSRCQVPTEEAISDLPPIIVPRKTVEMVARMLPDKGQVTIAVSPNRVSFTLDDQTVLISKLIDGTYPDYQRVVPTTNANRFLVDKAALSAAVDRVTTLATSKGSAVKFAFGDSDLTLTANNPDAGSAEESLSIIMEAGNPVEIGFNGRYCLDMLNAISAENVQFELGDGGSPAKIQPHDAGENPPYFVLMPMRV